MSERPPREFNYEPGDVIGKRFLVRRLIGLGGMGAVYEVTDSVLKGEFALKLLLPGMREPEYAKRFIREVRLAQTVTHQNVCRVYDIALDGSFFVMELLVGETLKSILKRKPRLETNDLMPILSDVCAGLGAIHAQGITHRDLKPENIIIVERRGKTTAIITDFGIAKSHVATDASLTREGALIGSPPYMSPEQVGGTEITSASDIWALGVIIYEALTGIRPFAAPFPVPLINDILAGSYTPLRIVRADLPAVWDQIVAACLRCDPTARVPTPADLLAALDGRTPLATLSKATLAPLSPPVQQSAAVITASAAHALTVDELGSIGDTMSVANPEPQRWPVDKIVADIHDVYLSEWGLKECWAEEEQGIRAAIRALDEGLPEYRYAYVKVLGVGGSGVVLRLKDSVFPEMDDALKFPRPVPGKVSFLSEMLTKEIQFLAELRHPGIIRILYHKVLSDVDIYRNLPFYLMEAVDGTRSDVYLRQLQVAAIKERTEEAQQRFEDDLLRLFINVLDSVQYLHHHPSGPRVHLDIKPENIVVTSSGQPVMIDLGTCKRVLLDKNSTIVACTLSMAAPSLARLLADDPSDANRAGGEIARDKILLSWDLWAFAVSMFRWLGIEHDNGELKKDAAADLLSAYSRKYLILLAARFMANEKLEDMPSWLQQRIGLSKVLLRAMAVTSSKEGLDLFERLRGASNPLAAIPELASRAVTTIQPSAGLHVALTPRLTALLENRALRRLDSIAQLGMVVEVYPEARHTRKEHSLGTYGWTIQYLHALYSDPVSPLFKQWITESDCRDVLLAAILHDIGHFPLAHDLEDIDGDLFNHADMTAAWLKGTFKRAAGGKLDFESLDTELDHWSSTVDRVLAILGAKANSSSQSILPKAKLLLSLISGPIDADKLDYLLRDADRMHLPYPLGIDVDRILKSLTTVVIDKVQSGARDVPVIGVHAKGKIAAEFVSIARYAMFSQGYWHHTVRAMKAMLARAVRALTDEATDDARSRFQLHFLRFVFSLPEAIFHNGDNQKQLFSKSPTPNPIPDTKGTEVPQLAVTDVVTLRWLEQRLVEQRRSESALLEGILSRKLYKRLWVVSRDMQRDHWDEIVRLWTALRRQKKHQLASVFERNVSSKLFERGVTAITATKLGDRFNPTSLLSGDDARQVIEINVASKVPWLLIDIPESRPGAEVGLYYVLEGQRRQLRKDDKVTGSIQESEVWTQYASNLLQAAGKIRIFCDPRLVDAVDASIAWEEGIELLTNSLVALKS